MSWLRNKIVKWIAHLDSEEVEDLKITIEELEADKEMLEDTIADLEEEAEDPKMMMSRLLPVGASWYAYEELEKEQLRAYQDYAKQLTLNPVLKNEIEFLVNNYAKQSLQSAETEEQLRDMRVSVIALRSLQRRLDEIPVPVETKQSTEHIYEGV